MEYIENSVPVQLNIGAYTEPRGHCGMHSFSLNLNKTGSLNYSLPASAIPPSCWFHFGLFQMIHFFPGTTRTIK